MKITEAFFISEPFYDNFTLNPT